MFRLTIAQLRASVRRFIAPGIAIIIGTAFVTITLISGSVMTQVTEDNAAGLGDAASTAYTVFVLVFALIAMLVAALVIANTFQVLIAGRMKLVALQRCIGVTTGQVYRSVIAEAAALGAAASALGILLGLALSQMGLSILSARYSTVIFPASIPVSLVAILGPLVFGTLVTVLASLRPARAATRVSPIAALRPADMPAESKRENLLRMTFSVIFTVAGFAVAAWAVWTASPDHAGTMSEETVILAAALGIAVSFIGMVVTATYWLAPLASVTSRLFGRVTPTAHLAAMNIRRNPRRTAATATAMLIGVTLVITVATAATSARRTLDERIAAMGDVDPAVVSSIETFINTALAVIIALLAVSLVIAVVGVANTLSLSVVERRKENATLRAIGLTRGRLRGMLALEGAFIALIGAACGVLLGVLYGFIGADVILGHGGAESNSVILAVPWGYIVASILIAILAGLLASVLPAMSAAKATPVEALAAE
ncbi:MAG: FtsX-like permease family protein [Cellulomonadaceae bacterium]|nr:FtsX-like permease family protein [Cellulomonadaceae bacterium]